METTTEQKNTRINMWLKEAQKYSKSKDLTSTQYVNDLMGLIEREKATMKAEDIQIEVLDITIPGNTDTTLILVEEW